MFLITNMLIIIIGLLVCNIPTFYYIKDFIPIEHENSRSKVELKGNSLKKI